MIPTSPYGVTKEILCLYLAVYNMTWIMIDYSFLYRLWAVKSPLRVGLFSNPFFIALLFTVASIESVVWFCSTYFLFFPTDTGRLRMRDNTLSEFGVDTSASVMIMGDNYLDDHSFNFRPISLVAVSCGVMAVSFGFMIYAIIDIIHRLKTLTLISKNTLRLQRQLFVTLCLQTIIPLIVLYSPCGVMIVLPLFRVNYQWMARATPLLISFFLPLDALAVLLSMTDYRREIIRMIRCACHSTQHRTESMLFCEHFKWFCIGTCVVSWFLNGLLCFIVQRRQTGVGFYRFFTYSSVLIGVSYSLSFAAAQPFWYTGPGMLGVFSIAPWNHNELLISFAFQFWFTSFCLVILCMSCSFAYRFGMLCSARIVSWFEAPRRFAITSCFLMAMIGLWLYNANYFLYAESQDVRKKMHEKFAGEFDIDLLTSYALTVNLNDRMSANHSILGTFIITAIMQLQILMMVYCGWQIHRSIKVRTMSEKLKRLHGRALKMMISQALNPLLFLYIPCFVNMPGMFVETDFGDLPSKIIVTSLALFPIFNPIIIISFTEEYKRYLLNRRTSSVQVSLVMAP